MKSNSRSLDSRKLALVLSFLMIVVASLALPYNVAMAQDEEPEFTRDFRLEDCVFKTRGVNPYFILKPGYQLVLEGEEEGDTVVFVNTVLHETKEISLPDIGTIKTRVVEERHLVNGELVEVSRNFFAICDKTNDVYYFGEEVDIFNEDGNVTHEGAWLAGEPDEDGLAEPGIIMPGTFLLGSRYYQELADGIALGRAEHTEMGLEITTPAGTFADCVQVTESDPLDPGGEGEKIYCPEVGLTVDDGIELVEYGFIELGGDDDDDN